MPSLTRLRAHAGLWTLVAVLAGLAVLVAAAAGPAIARVEDRALRKTIEQARSYLDRDIVALRPSKPSLMGIPPTPPEEFLTEVEPLLLPPLRDVEEARWAFQRTTVDTFNGVGATLTGDGVVAAPDGFAPVVTLLFQPDLERELRLLSGRPPATSPADGVVEVLVAAEVAEALGLRAGGEYLLHPGIVVNEPDVGRSPNALVLRVSGVFQPLDVTAPVWDHARSILDVGVTSIPQGLPPLTTLQATFVTDREAFDLLIERGLTAALRPETGARFRLSADLVDAAWVPGAVDALARLQTTGVEELTITTRLPRLLDDYLRQAAAARAITAVATVGILATLLGLLVLAARLITDRRSGELALLRARGGSVPAVVQRLLAEGLWVLPPAVCAGWLASRVVLGGPVTSVPAAGELVAPALAAGVGLLVVPMAGMVAVRVHRLVGDRADLFRRESGRRRGVRLTAEVTVVALAVTGVALTHQRGLTLAGVDPYLSAVPVLLAVATGLVALRIYPLPLRLLAAATRRMRGAVGFVALARAARAAPGAATALLVLVLAVAVGGFAGAVNSGVAQARDSGAAQALGADVRVVASDIPPEGVSAVAAVPGVTTVATVSRDGTLVDTGREAPLREVAVVVVDVEAYQRVLADLGVGGRLPGELLSAAPGAGPVPVLAPAGLVARGELVVRLGERDYPVRVVGDVAGLPGPDRDRRWMLVPRQALEDARPVHELLVAGDGVDPDRVREVVGSLALDAEVSSVVELRRQLADSGFNEGLRLVFVAGTVGGGAGAVLAVTLALVVQARPRGRVLSLLRTMGLSHRQARALLLAELLPVTAVAVAVGAAAGLATPLLLAPALGLERFTGGVPLAVGADPLVVGVLGGAVLALVLLGVVVESGVNRRLGLGDVLRVT
ncbi:MAG: FtsX-like permease family protein [Micromonosporaceae bacterium]